MLGAFAGGFAQRDPAQLPLGSCAAYSGHPAEEGETAGMAFIPGGTFVMGSERHQPEERFTHDTGTSVDDKDYQVPFKFTGKLSKLTLTIERPKLTPEDERRQMQDGQRNNRKSE
jgi:hypothetical protein